MRIFSDISDPSVASLLAEGKVGVIRTDTLYGLVGKADTKDTVERIYSLKTRTPTKPFLLLISNTSQLLDSYDTATFEDTVWPGPNTVILPSPTAPDYLTRGGGTLAYRIPDDESLRDLLSATGPLVAPSANPEGEQPARSTQEAMEYFGEDVDFYIDGGKVADNTPSKIWQPKEDGTMERLR